MTKVVQLRWKRVFSTFPSWRNEKAPLGSNSTRSVSYLHFGLVFSSIQKAWWKKVVQLRWKRVFSTFPIVAKRKSTLGIEFYEVGFIPPFSVGFSKQRKKPGWRRSSNCVENAFFRPSPSGRNEKAPLGSNSTRSVSYLHFGLVFPSSAKSRVEEGRPIALKRRFFDFPHHGETKKHPWDRILRGRFHTSILGWFFQAAQKAGLKKIVQLRWKRVFSTFPIGAIRKSTLGIEFYEVGFIPPFWVGFSKQRKKPGWRRSSNCVENAFFRLSPSGRNEKAPLGSNSTRSVSYLHFGLVFPSSAKSRVDEGRPIALKTRFFDFPHRGETKKHPWDRILRGRFHTSILGWFFQAAQKAGLKKVVQLRWKRVFSTFPIGAKRKSTLGIEFYEVGFIPPFWVGFASSLISRVDEGRPIALKTRFFDFPIVAKRKSTLGIEFYEVGFIPPFWVHTSIFQAAQKAGLTRVVQLLWKRVFFAFPIGAKRKSTIGIEFYDVGFIPPFWVPSSAKSWVFPSIQKAGLTKVVQLRWKRVFSTFLIGAKRKSTFGIEFYEVGFIPPFWVGFSKQRKKLGWRGSSNWVENAFFLLSPSGRNEKAPLGSNFTRSVSYLYFGLVFQSSAKSRVEEGRPIALKTRIFDFPHLGETKKHPWDPILRGRFHTTILGGLLQAAHKPALSHSYNFVQNVFFRLSPSERNEKAPLGSNSTRSVWYLHFGLVFPSSVKSRVDEGRIILFKTRFFDFPHRGETKKHPGNRILQFRFHTTILGGLFQAAHKAGLTKVV